MKTEEITKSLLNREKEIKNVVDISEHGWKKFLIYLSWLAESLISESDRITFLGNLFPSSMIELSTSGTCVPTFFYKKKKRTKQETTSPSF